MHHIIYIDTYSIIMHLQIRQEFWYKSISHSHKTNRAWIRDIQKKLEFHFLLNTVEFHFLLNTVFQKTCKKECPMLVKYFTMFIQNMKFSFKRWFMNNWHRIVQLYRLIYRYVHCIYSTDLSQFYAQKQRLILKLAEAKKAVDFIRKNTSFISEEKRSRMTEITTEIDESIENIKNLIKKTQKSLVEKKNKSVTSAEQKKTGLKIHVKFKKKQTQFIRFLLNAFHFWSVEQENILS